ncbi:MAG: hypothetical protein ACNS60_10075 [Candidatus Cyclobacteriaceae bacterium M2_1C_046]
MILKSLYICVTLLIGFPSPNKQPLKFKDVPILILPLGGISDRDIGIIKDTISSFCKCNVKILDRIVDPYQIIAFENTINPFKNTVLDFLSSFATETKVKIIGITDIPFGLTPNVSSENTIRGFSKLNGTSTIISNEQIIRDALKYDINYHTLLVKVVRHELGHLYGIEHCSDTLCIMTSSFPIPDNFIKSKVFCDSCSNALPNKFKYN